MTMVPDRVGLVRSDAGSGVGRQRGRRILGLMSNDLPSSAHTVVIGAGHAGLLMSRLLRQSGREHVVLERRPTLGGGWQDRWDEFRLVSPNFATSLPDFRYDGTEPDAFMGRDEIAARTARYAAVIDAPVALETEVRRVSPADHPARGFVVETSRGVIRAREIVGATGAFHTPKIPATAAFGTRIHQVHAHDYRNAASLPEGGVLVVGTGQTGVQLAEELHDAGRAVTLSVGHCGRAARRYRDRDWFWWVIELVRNGPKVGVELPTVGNLPDPRQRFACNPHLSGHGGGHDTNLRRFAASGIRLVGRFMSAEGERARFADDLESNLQFADGFFDERIRPIFEKYADRAGLDLPPDDREPFEHTVPEVTDLDLAAEGISTVVWTTGYAPDYDWLDVPVEREFGVPKHVRGVTQVPGLTFIGMLFQLDNGSANLTGVARDAEYLASRWEGV
jgi:putative flavoprotein involved in K+ transport